MVSQACRDAEACGQRWNSLPPNVRRELPTPGSVTSTEIAWRARQVRDELTRMGEDLWAEDMSRVADRSGLKVLLCATLRTASAIRPATSGSNVQPSRHTAKLFTLEKTSTELFKAGMPAIWADVYNMPSYIFHYNLRRCRQASRPAHRPGSAGPYRCR